MLVRHGLLDGDQPSPSRTAGAAAPPVRAHSA
jgi:hypothetical protein